MKKGDLKAYIRYDSNGRIIPGGPLLSRIKPKVGNWQEISAYECCNPTTSTTTSTTTTILLSFRMLFDDISNADLMVGGDSSSVDDWNTFFDLPLNGTAFDSVTVNGDEVTLNGGGNMTLSAYLFGDNDPTGTSLLEVEDNGVTVLCEDGVFSDYNFGNGCYGVTSIILPSMNIDGTKDVFMDCEVLVELNIDFDSIITLGNTCFGCCYVLPAYSFLNLITAGDFCFWNYYSLIDFSGFPLLTSIGTYCFAGCKNIDEQYAVDLLDINGGVYGEGLFSDWSQLLDTSLDYSSITNIGKQCFRGCTSLISPNFSELVNASTLCFFNCTNLTSLNLSKLTNIGLYVFKNCTNLVSLGLPVCTNLGGTTANNYVFQGITGKTITITIPHALETDGDIVWLKANNTVTVIYSD